MENLTLITDFFARVWELFTLQHPLLGVPYSIIYMGSFAVALSIAILKPIIGIGGGVVVNVSNSARYAARHIRAKNQARKIKNEKGD